MITVTPALSSLLSSSNVFFAADLYTFTLLNGSVLRYNSSDVDLSFGGTTWLGTALVIERSKIKTVIGVQVDQLEVTAYPAATDRVSGNTVVKLAVNGGLDGCTLQLDRAFAPGPGQAITGIVPKRFVGRISEVKAGRSSLKLTVKSDLDLLNIQMPRVLFQAPCSHSLYDGGCQAVRAAFTSAGTVAAGGSSTGFGTSLTQADGYFNLGVITFTGGANAGLSRYVQSYLMAAGAIKIVLPFPAAPAAGDAFSIYPGCDKTAATCAAKFSNLQHYRGFPYVPNQETALL